MVKNDFSFIFHSDTILFAAKLRLLFVPYLFFCGKYLDKFEQITIVVFVEDAVLTEDVVDVFEWFCAETSEALQMIHLEYFDFNQQVFERTYIYGT